MPVDLLKSKSLNGALCQWKIAGDGKWENAQVISASPGAEEINSIANWIISGPEDIAFEPVFQKPDGNFFFFGVRIKKLDASAKIKCLRSILYDCVTGTGFAEVLKIVQAVLHVSDLFAGMPDFMEVGAEGFWKSYGYYRIWDRVSKPSIATVEEIAEHAPQILEPFKRSMMLEYAWQEPFPSWIAVQLSRKTDELFEFSPELYAELIKNINPKA